MVEMIFVLAVSVFVFLFLFLALSLKNRARNKSTPIPTCQTCNCHKKGHHPTQKTRMTQTDVPGVTND